MGILNSNELKSLFHRYKMNILFSLEISSSQNINQTTTSLASDIGIKCLSKKEAANFDCNQNRKLARIQNTDNKWYHTHIMSSFGDKYELELVYLYEMFN